MSERVLIYGSRTWTDHAAIKQVVGALPRDAIVIHGGARGADSLADDAAFLWGLERKVFRADWQRHGKAAGPIRNQAMIDEGQPTRAYGFRMPGESRGTDDCTRRLKRAGIPVVVLSEDGSIYEE
jgi:hypothetical protein